MNNLAILLLPRNIEGEYTVLFKKEKEVIELILKHLDLVEDSLKTGIRYH